jgi:anti-sigma regulatory factor (Ser/Thr protein kinase)
MQADPKASTNGRVAPVENAALRAEAAGARIEAHLPLDVHAPAAARSAVTDCLGDRVAPSVLDDALLLATELVTNSVRHSGLPAGAELVVGVTLMPAGVRVHVDDPGHGGAIAPRPPDADGGGFGLNIVQTLSERWGVERAARGGTRVWAQLARAPLPAPASIAS